MRSTQVIVIPVLVLTALSACAGAPDTSRTTPEAPAAGVEQPVAPALPAGQPAPTAPAPQAARTTPNTTTPSAGPSQFVVSDLKIAPAGVRLGELTTVTVKVTNTGTTRANYTAVLHVKPAWAEARITILPQASQEVTLGPGESTVVTFRTGVMGNGYVIVQIEDQADRFTVDSQV